MLECKTCKRREFIHIVLIYMEHCNKQWFSFDRYDPQLNKWTKVASMSTRRLGVGVAVLGGYLYAVGGSDGTSPLNTGKGLSHHNELVD